MAAVASYKRMGPRRSQGWDKLEANDGGQDLGKTRASQWYVYSGRDVYWQSLDGQQAR